MDGLVDVEVQETLGTRGQEKGFRGAPLSLLSTHRRVQVRKVVLWKPKGAI